MRGLWYFALLSLLIALSFATSKSNVTPAGNIMKLNGWKKQVRASSEEVITMGFAVKQNNLDQLDDVFWKVSTPSSPQYGKHLTSAQLGDLIGADESILSFIQSHLRDNNAMDTRVSATRDYIWADMKAKDIETMLSIELHTFSFVHEASKKIAYIIRSTDTPKLPTEIANHLDFVSGAWNFPETSSLFSPLLSRNKDAKELPPTITPAILLAVANNDTINVYFEPMCAEGNYTENLTPCSDYGNPITFFNVTTYQYDYNEGKMVVQSNAVNTSFCAIEQSIFGSLLYCVSNSTSGLLYDSYVNVTFSYCFQDGSCIDEIAIAGFDAGSPLAPSARLTPSDVSSHYRVPKGTVAKSQNSTQSVAEFIFQFFSVEDLDQFFQQMGLPTYKVAKIVGTNNDGFPGVEASLDIQYIMAIGENVGTWFWYSEGTSFIAEWAQAVLNTPNAPLVHSISYGEDESGVSSSYLQRGEIELQKLGAAGISVIVSSGDYGSADQCSTFTPDWPASSPYVTAVGATRITRGATPLCQITPSDPSCLAIGEVGVSGNLGLSWSSGAGISNVNPMPTYQLQQVSNYLNSVSYLPPANLFNTTGRAYPDVTTVGHNLLVVDGGVTMPVDGTSASAPIFAGLISLLNDARFQAGKTSSLGFLNPWIYDIAANTPSSFYDVTVADTTYCSGNLCCPVQAFVASQGFDIASGWGTPQFDVLLKLALQA